MHAMEYHAMWSVTGPDVADQREKLLDMFFLHRYHEEGERLRSRGVLHGQCCCCCWLLMSVHVVVWFVNVDIVVDRSFILRLRRRYDVFWNADPWGDIRHHCYEANNCNCKTFEDTVQSMTTVLLQTLLLRRPKKPEVKEWSAVGVIGMCFPIVCCMSFLLFCVILQCIYFYLFARPKRQLERLRMHVWYSTQDRGSSFGKHRPIRCGTCCAEAFLALHVCICTVCLRCRACAMHW